MKYRDFLINHNTLYIKSKQTGNSAYRSVIKVLKIYFNLLECLSTIAALLLYINATINYHSIAERQYRKESAYSFRNFSKPLKQSMVILYINF